MIIREREFEKVFEKKKAWQNGDPSRKSQELFAPFEFTSSVRRLYFPQWPN